MRHRFLSLCLALWLTSALIGCGGGSGGSAPTGPGQALPPPAARTTLGTVLAKVADTSGVPVAGAGMSLTASNGDVVQAVTDTAGEVRFPNVPAGTATLGAYSQDHYQPPSQVLTVVARSEVSAAFTLEPRNATTAVVLGSRVVSKGADGSALDFEIDLALLDPSGQPLTNLPDVAFYLGQIDCGWGGPCVVGPAGWIDAWYDTGTGRPQSFGLQPARARHPVAAGLLIDQGARSKAGEPHRSAALAEFLAALGGTDSTLLAEFRGRDSDFRFTPSGGFVSDGRSLLPLVQGLPDRLDSEDSDSVSGTQSMLTHLAQQFATAPKALVALTDSDTGCDVSDGWVPSCQRLVELSRASGIPVTTASGAFSFAGADLARRTGGAVFFIDFPAQYRTAMRGLLSVVGGEIPFYRMRFAVTVTGSPVARAKGIDVLAAGNTLYAYLEIRISERAGDVLHADVVVPL